MFFEKKKCKWCGNELTTEDLRYFPGHGECIRCVGEIEVAEKRRDSGTEFRAMDDESRDVSNRDEGDDAYHGYDGMKVAGLFSTDNPVADAAQIACEKYEEPEEED